MRSEKLIPYIKWGIYYFLLIILFSIQTTPKLFEVFSVKPVIVISLAICVAMYEGVMTSCIFGLVAGLLWDISSDKVFGFNGLILLISCMFVSLLCIYYLRTKWINSIIFVAATCVVQGLLEYMFYFKIWNYDVDSIILLNKMLPTYLYTIIITPITFLIVSFFAKKFNLISRI